MYNTCRETHTDANSPEGTDYVCSGHYLVSYLEGFNPRWDVLLYHVMIYVKFWEVQNTYMSYLFS
jgi:hypothetical protein